MMQWAGISEFVTVAERQSFTAAAQVLTISTAQVSRQITQLEKRLGVTLFYRSTRKVVLSEEGKLFYRHCRQLLDGLNDAERALSSLRNMPNGHLKMTASVVYGEQYVMPIVLDYMARYPEVSVQCDLTNQTVDLLQGGYDLAVRLGRLNDSSLIAKRLSERVQFVCASPAYIQRYGAPHSLNELAAHNCLIGTHRHWHFQENGNAKSIRVDGNLQCSSGYALCEAAVRGLGLVQLPGYYVKEALANKQLVELLSSYKEPQQGIWAIYPNNRQLSPKVRLLVEMLGDGLHSR